MAPETAMVVSYTVGIGVAGLYILHKGTSVLGTTVLGLAALASGTGTVALLAH